MEKGILFQGSREGVVGEIIPTTRPSTSATPEHKKARELTAKDTVRTLALVRAAGLEPAHRMATEPKSVESTNSTTPAYPITQQKGTDSSLRSE